MTTQQSLEQLTGLWQALSGDVADNSKVILGMPSKADIANLTVIHSSRFNSLETNVTTIQNTLNDIVGFMQNLKSAHVSLEESFIGHTGKYVYDLAGAGTTGAHHS